MARRQPMIRTNEAYRLDSRWELVILIGRGMGRLIAATWRTRTELGLALLALLVFAELRRWLAPTVAAVTLAGVVALVLTVGPSRRLLIGRVGCSRSRRLLRRTLLATNVDKAGAGSLPRVLRSRTTPAGQRLLLSCRPGQSVELLDARVEELRAGLRARHVTVTRAPNRADRVTLDVIRREVLAGVVITSPLVAVAAGVTGPTDPALLTAASLATPTTPGGVAGPPDPSTVED